MLSHFARNAAFGVLATFASMSSVPAFAAATDYQFEVVSTQPAGPAKTEVTLRLIHLPDGKPVVGAVVFQVRGDMGPEGMADMATTVTPEPAQPDGLIRYQVATSMAGRWALTLSAKVQGESQTVKGSVTFKGAQ
jgi:carbon monoxide dehydrogenase subunit G